ncbi:MAG TPA: HDOD domain-containing protein [Planctomycetota bacterium]|nr:HDOD domain-containing protein [Planctomycetota bacterium]
MPQKDYKKMVEEARGLPALASVVTTVMNAVIEDTSAADIARIIEKDSSVTARILKVINSAFYGLSGHVSTVSQAVPLLGIQVVKNIVLTFSVLDIFPHGEKDGFRFQKLWEHSFAVAVACRLLARETRYEDPEEALVAGLLHDIGVLIFTKHGLDEYQQVLKIHEETDRPLADIEQETMGITHAEVGALLAEKWKLPEVLIVPMRYHHDEVLPDEMPRQSTLLTNIVHVADVMCQIFSVSASREGILTFKELAQSRLDLSDEVLVDILKAISREMEIAAESFMVIPPRSYIEVLEQAHLELGRLNLSYLLERQPIS